MNASILTPFSASKRSVSISYFAPGNWLNTAMNIISTASYNTSVQEHTVVKVRKLGTTESFHIWTKLIKSPVEDGANRAERRYSGTEKRQSSFPINARNISRYVPWHGRQSCLIQEACPVITVKESFRVEDAACQVLQIDTSEAVGGSGVASHAKDARVCSVVDREVRNYFWDIVLRGSRATVPVERNAFLPWLVCLSER